MDQVLIAGGTEADVTSFKIDEVVTKVGESAKEHGFEPRLFAKILRRATGILKEFLEILMKKM